MNIVVLAGGLSTERDVSFVSGINVSKALRERGHNVILLDSYMGYGTKETDVSDIFSDAEAMTDAVMTIAESAPDLEAVRAMRPGGSDAFFGPNVIRICQLADMVFMVMHGENGENGKVQAAFDLFGIRYTGSDYVSSALAMDKELAKRLFVADGIPTPNGICFSKEVSPVYPEATGLNYPVVVKPCCGGSSIGVSIVSDRAEYEEALENVFLYEDRVIVEECIEGREFSVGVIGGEALPVIEIEPTEGFYNYKNKYKAGSTIETCPADLPDYITRQMQMVAVGAAETLGLTSYSRMDFLLSTDNQVYCLEANTLPGMTPTSLLPQEAAAAGMDFGTLCETLIQMAIDRYEGNAK